MVNKDNGGSAFPTSSVTLPDGAVICGEFGMTLRDYFAAKAMGGLINYSPDPEEHASIASLCYQLADAMLKAREA